MATHAGPARRAVVLAATALAATALLLVAAGGVARAAPDARDAVGIEDVEQSLLHDPSYRVRVSAALVLARLAKPRSVPALLAALDDPHPAVRGTAAQALGKIGDPSARAALQAATLDGSPLVQRMAEDALAALAAANKPPARTAAVAVAARPVRLAFEVKPMGDPSHHATPALRGHMRDYLSTRLRPAGDVSVEDVAPARGFVVDGAIKSLAVTFQPTMVEVACSVQLVISRQPTGGVFLLTTGEAIVSKPRHQFHPQQRAGMEVEALENAVRGASDDLLRRLAQP